jgi:hypothetical protein
VQPEGSFNDRQLPAVLRSYPRRPRIRRCRLERENQDESYADGWNLSFYPEAGGYAVKRRVREGLLLAALMGAVGSACAEGHGHAGGSHRLRGVELVHRLRQA